MTTFEGPLVGWRIWRYADGRLHSWFVDYGWEAGAREATCLIQEAAAPPAFISAAPCAAPPGSGCRCGFWALWDPRAAIRKGRRESLSVVGTPVLGIMAGWGEVAIHGAEGFRSRHASVLCLIADGIWSRRLDAVAGRLPWLLAAWSRWIPRADYELPDSALKALPQRYGVPMVSMADALSKGIAGEFGWCGVPDAFQPADKERAG